MDRCIEKEALSGGAEEELLQNWLKKKKKECGVIGITGKNGPGLRG